MQSKQHKSHIASRTGHHGCPECNADRERRFVPSMRWSYQHAAEYLALAKAGFANKGVRLHRSDDRLTADQFRREFVAAMHQRISLKMNPQAGRKHCHSYLERLNQWRAWRNGMRVFTATADYLRTFASRGASAL